MCVQGMPHPMTVCIRGRSLFLATHKVTSISKVLRIELSFIVESLFQLTVLIQPIGVPVKVI